MSGGRTAPKIPGYRIVGFLGRGGMGSVWRARRDDGTDAAVKVTDRPLRLSDEEVRRFFRREALACLNIEHRNLVRGLDVGETDEGQPFIALEFVDGATLAERIAGDTSLPDTEVVGIGRALASALAHAHRMGVLHRDIKPANVMLTHDGDVKLLDLGLVVERGGGDTGRAVGTPGYTSPECLRGEATDVRSDLYSLGLTLAAAVLGRNPFGGADAKETARRNRDEPLALPAEVGGRTVGEGLRAVIEKLTRKDRDERYRSADELLLDLEAVALGERPLGAVLSTVARLSGLRRRRSLIAAASAGVVLLAAAFAGGAWLLLRPPGPDFAPPPVIVQAPPTPTDPVDARLDALELFLEEQPDDFSGGRALIARVREDKLSDEQLARTQGAHDLLEGRFEERADALLADRLERIGPLLEDGDLREIETILTTWPEAFRETRQAAKASAQAAEWRREARAIAEALAKESPFQIALFEVSVEAHARVDARAARDLRKRLESTRRRWRGDADLAARFADLLQQLDTVEEAAAKAAAERGAERALRGMLQAMSGRWSLRPLRVALREVATDPAHSETALMAEVRGVLFRADNADRSLAQTLAPVAGRPWAAVLRGKLHVGLLESAPRPRDVTPLNLSLRLGDGPPLAPGDWDLVHILDGNARMSAWLLAEGLCDFAARYADHGDRPTRLIDVHLDGPALDPDLERDLTARIRLTLRPVDSAPAPGSPDPSTRAWQDVVAAGKPPPTAGTRNDPAKTRGRDAFLGDDLLAAWTALEQAAARAPHDAEIAVLRSHVLWRLSEPLRTAPIMLLALSEARRAWDLDPGLPAGPQQVARIAAEIVRLRPGPLAAAVEPLALRACEEIWRQGSADAASLLFLGEHWLDADRAVDALPLLRQATAALPDDGRAHLALGRAEAAAGKSTDARRALQRAERLLGADFPASAARLLGGLDD